MKKKKLPQGSPTLERRNFPKPVRDALDALDVDLARREMSAAIHRVKARQQFSAIVHGLVGIAATLARKGKPRLLATLARILGDERLDERSTHLLQQLGLSIGAKTPKPKE
jgi:hypothetical protein